MKKPFAVGDRVRVYGHKAFDWKDTIATVVTRHGDTLSDPDFIEVRTGPGLRVLVHPKQCRRLVPKKKKWEWRYRRVLRLDTGDLQASSMVYRSAQEALTLELKNSMTSPFKTVGYERVKVYLKEKE